MSGVIGFKFLQPGNHGPTHATVLRSPLEELSHADAELSAKFVNRQDSFYPFLGFHDLTVFESETLRPPWGRQKNQSVCKSLGVSWSSRHSYVTETSWQILQA